MARPAGEEAAAAAARRRGESPTASRLLVSFQYVHVQLGGGAPWGFTLRGGLEHGEPLIVSKVEDGGKAALSQKMRPGDELVNINGTPLYGSRQEALILIKGSYRTLKMIIRRRNVPVIRPHSWHLAKLSEVRTETATMHFPADAFSLSWHSGCDTSDLSLPWNPLSRHCSTDKSSSLGSMESLDQPSQTYYEGSLSPIDQAMYQNKRDSAYSSFSASSNTSDSALRPEENSSAEYTQQGQLPDPRYLQTGSEGGETSGTVGLPSLAGQLSARPASCTQESHFPSSAKAFAPPQPPVRQDSLRACNPSPAGTETQGALPQANSLHPKGRWTSDISLCVRGRDSAGTCGQLASASHAKESLPTDQYYLLSSHAERHLPMERGAQSVESLLNEEGEVPPPEEPAQRVDSQEREAELGDRSNVSPVAWKDCWSGPLAHRHSAPEQLLAAQLQALNVAHSQEGPHWTVSPLHVGSRSPRTQESWQTQGHGCQSRPGQAQERDIRPASGEGPLSPRSSHAVQERPRSASVELPSSLLMPPSEDADSASKAVPTMDPLTEGGRDSEGSRPAARKGGSAQHRSAQMRRRSDRFATNLRNEIQWRKAQLQKAKGSAMLLCGEEPVQEAEEPPDSPTAPAPSPPPPPPPAPVPPPLPAESRPPHRTAAGPKRWGSELSVLWGEAAPQSPSRVPSEPKWKAPLPEMEKPPAALPLPSGGRGRWRWSPEHKLQPHSQSPPGLKLGSPSQPPEESGLLPFADRRKFFEETSKAPASAHAASRHGRPGGLRPRAVEQNSFQPVSSEHRDQQRHSMDHPYCPPSSPPVYPEFRPEVPGFYKPMARHRDCECWRPLPCACVAREACAYCGGERCPTLLQRNMPVPSSHCTHRCHPRPWARCTDCCCPAQHQLLEDGGPWQGRKTYPPEFPLDDWEPPAINRKNSQSMSELAQQKMGFVRVGPFWPRSENFEPEWPPFCRASSTHSLSWDGERPSRAEEEEGAYEEGAAEPRRHPLRERAYSESHLCGESGGASRRQRQEAPLAKLEELPCLAKKKGLPPPRPPPPKWEKYHPRRASHHQLLPTEGGLAAVPEDSCTSSQNNADVARQRSQSLPLEHFWGDAAQEAQLRPRGSPVPKEPGSLHYYCRGSPRGTPEWLTPDLSGESDSSRPASSLAEDAKPELSWDKEQNAESSRGPEKPRASPSSLCSKDDESAQERAGGESRPPGMASPAPPFRLNSEELMRDVAGRDRSLAGVLNPASGPVTAAEVMSDLFSPSEWKGQDWQPQVAGKGLPERHPAQPVSPTSGGTSCSAYYNLSSGKAELLNKMKELPGASVEEEEPDHDLARKKVQLIESISRKLAVLQEAQRGLQDDINGNVVLGKEVESHVKGVCKPHEFEKFRLFIGDLDKVVNLLLSLSGRLARVENALGSLGADAPEEEKLALLEKKRQLTAQLEDAKELQEHVAQRERVVFTSVSRCLPGEQLQDYQHFVRMTSALAIQQRQLDDKIKLGEEQLRCLRESLRRVPWDC